MNNSGVGRTSLPLTLRWVEGLWECWVEGHALPEPDPQRAVRKLCQQHSRPESLGLPHPSGALRIDPGALPRSSLEHWERQTESCPCGPLAAGPGAPCGILIPVPTFFPVSPPRVSVSHLCGPCGFLPSCCHISVPSTWTAFSALWGPATVSRKCSQVPLPGRDLFLSTL